MKVNKIANSLLQTQSKIWLTAVVVACSTATAETAFDITTTPIDTGEERRRQVTNFASDFITIMSTESSRIYLANTHLANSSTFPALVTHRMASRRWKASPFLPVPEQDLACYFSVPPYRVPRKFDSNTEPLRVEADSVKGDLNQYTNELTYEGRVLVMQGDHMLETEKIHYNGKEQVFTSSGHSIFHTPELTVQSDEEARLQLKDRFIFLKNARFNVNGSVLRGGAGAHQYDRQRNIQVATDGFITTCPDGDDFWTLGGSKIEIDRNKDFGEIWDPVLRLGDVPVFYLPYADFPITNKRKSGLLYPEISLGSSSIKYGQPIYLNLAPNYDYTITPTWNGKRHWQVDQQFRFLPVENLYGTVFMQYLPDDQEWDNPVDDDRKRWFFSIKTNWWLLDHDLNIDLNYNRARPGDYDYLNDIIIDEKSSAHADDFLIESLQATYIKTHFELAAEVRKYQSLLPGNSTIFSPFSMLPQLKGSWEDSYGPVYFRTDAEITRFSMEDEGQFDSFHSERYHLQPGVLFHILDSRGTTLDASGRLFITHYNQDSPANATAAYRNFLGYENLDSSTTRFLYELEIRGKTSFERPCIDMRHIQTIEPEFKYQYIPYRNQNGLALYDTTDTQEDFYSLYSWRRFAGIDRIADVNALTMGVTSRILDPHDREILSLGLAQTYSFDPTRVTLRATDEKSDYPRSPLVFTMDANPLEGLTAHAGVSYDGDKNLLNSYNGSLRYVTSGGFSSQINYRYMRNGQYDMSSLEKSSWQYTDLRQLGLQVTVPFANKYKAVAAWYQDLDQGYSIDRKLALKYEECCWSMTIGYERYAKMDWRNLDHKFESVVGIQLELKSFFGANISGIKKPDSPDTHYMPFIDPTNLNN